MTAHVSYKDDFAVHSAAFYETLNSVKVVIKVCNGTPVMNTSNVDISPPSIYYLHVYYSITNS